jgi:hypothetical protein
MTSEKSNLFCRATVAPNLRIMVCAFVTGASLLGAVTSSFAGDDPDHEPSARELYNDGTHKLNEGKLTEAESYLQSAVAAQDERVQSPALYNLGLTRFKQGVNELTNGPAPAALDAQSGFASQSGASALHAVDNALAGDDVQAMVAAYLRGRGARRELKGAVTAVQRAMDTFGVVLAKWRRASGDFHSTVELQPTDTNAQINAKLTDRYIAKLVDLLQMMMQRQAGMQQQREELRKKMAELKGKLPDQTGSPMLGDDGDDDDDDSKKSPQPPKLGDQEGPVKDGREMQLTFEEARRLLNLLQLDTGRKLYLGSGDENPKPGNHPGRDW